MMGEHEAVAALAALGHEHRLRIFRLLVRAGESGLRVGDIQRHLGIPPSTLAHHLDTLARAGLVRQHRCGREVRSRVDFTRMNALLDHLREACCAGVPSAAEEVAEKEEVTAR